MSKNVSGFLYAITKISTEKLVHFGKLERKEQNILSEK
jgi:hypothetical protein